MGKIYTTLVLLTLFFKTSSEVKNSKISDKFERKVVINTLGTNPDLCNCNKRKPIVITSNTAEIDYQIKLDVNFSSGMETDFSDIRFTDSDETTEISFWIEEYTASDDATVWVKIPSIPNGTKTIYMYYDDCDSSNISNANNTFIFYDDMSSIFGWNTIGSGNVTATTTTGDNTVSKTDNCDPNGGWKSIGTTITNFRLITREVRTSTGNNNSCGLNRYGLENSSFNGYNINRDARGGNRAFGLEARTGGSGNNSSRSNRSQPIDNWVRTELTRCCSNNTVTAQLYDDNRNAVGALISSTMPNNRNYCDFDRITLRGGHDYHVDFMAIAKSSCGTITASIGADDGFADLSLIKTVNNALPKVGSNITYTLRVFNSGPLCATGVRVEDVLPSGLTFVSASAPTGSSYNNTTGIWNLSSITILSGNFVELQITATITSSGIITNSAKIIDSDKLDSDSDPSN